MVKIEINTSGLRLNRTADRIKHKGESVAKFICIEASKIARTEHKYKNRTGKLQANTKANTRANPPQLEARTAYAKYVNAKPGYEFLRVAIEKAIKLYTRRRLWLRVCKMRSTER